MSTALQPFATTPEPPYYAVIFSSTKSGANGGYRETAEQMAALAAAQPGYLGAESVRGEDGFGITVSYWQSLDAIAAWRQHVEHLHAQSMGNELWYKHFEVRISKVERAYSKKT